MSACRRYHKLMDDGQVREASAAVVGEYSNDSSPYYHCNFGRKILKGLAKSSHGGLGFRCFPTFLYDQFRSFLGPGAVGYAE